jgi:putative ABC transport system substrate-binding protein
MKRRAFITLLGGAAAVWPLAVSAQQAGRMRHIGVLMALEENDPDGKAQLSGFTQGLSELGWSGSNLRIEVRWGGGDVNQIRTIAKELVATQPDLISARNTGYAHLSARRAQFLYLSSSPTRWERVR